MKLAKATLRQPKSMYVVPLFGALLVAGLWIGVLRELRHERESILAAELRDTSSYVASLAQHVHRTLAEHDRTLRVLKAQTERSGTPDPQWLREVGALLAIDVSVVAIINAEGRAVAGSASTLPDADFADRPYFRRHAAVDDDVMDVSAPIESRFDGARVVVLSRRLNDRDGRFAGIVAMGVNPEMFDDYFLAERLVGGGTVGVFGLDGTYRARVGDSPADVDALVAEPSLVQRSGNQPADAYPVIGDRDTVPRLLAYRRIGEHPLVAVATKRQDHVLAAHVEHRQGAIFRVVCWTALLVSFFTVLTFVLHRLRFKTAELRRQRSFLSDLLDDIPMGVSVRALKADGGGEYVVWNDTNAVMYGVGKEEALQRRLDAVVQPEVAERVRLWDREMMESPGVQETNVPELMPSGDQRHIHRIRAPLFDEQGVPRYVITVSDDVTHKKQLEDELLRASAVFETTADGIVVTDSQDIVVSVNPGFTRLTGLTAAEMIGCPMYESAFAPNDMDAARRMLDQLKVDRVAHAEVTRRHRDGRTLELWLTLTATADPAGRTVNYIRIFTDISPLKDAQRRLEQLAHFDTLTGLPNRALFGERLEQALARGRRAGKRVGLMFIDLDGFKRVNDEHGHDVGDELLKQAAVRLIYALRETDSLCRLGGDEFTVILENPVTSEIAAAIAERVRRALRQPFELRGRLHRVRASVGIAIYPTHGADVVTLTSHADVAMYSAKNAGGDRYAFYQAATLAEAEVLEPATS